MNLMLILQSVSPFAGGRSLYDAVGFGLCKRYCLGSVRTIEQ